MHNLQIRHSRTFLKSIKGVSYSERTSPSESNTSQSSNNCDSIDIFIETPKTIQIRTKIIVGTVSDVG